mmetsp:Transcript_67197/g.194320  ORF Transcript_67197/g.194320 Transcript_67197/m.194320 type:complete len:239 (-) Transcript_67197:53-769(-)
MATTARRPDATARPTTANRNPDVITSSQAYGLKRVGLFKFSPSPSSAAMAAKAHTATTPTVGSGRCGSKANPATISNTAARASTAMPNNVDGDAEEASARTLMFSALAATIQPRCTAKGTRSTQYSSTVKLMPSVTTAMPTRPTRIPNMHTTDNQMTSCAKTIVQHTWKAHAASHHGVEARTTSRPRYRGNICATTAAASPMKMTPQMLKAHPAGVTNVWYLSLRSVFVEPKMPVRET